MIMSKKGEIVYTGKSVDPLFTLKVPPTEIPSSKPSALGATGGRNSISSVCFLSKPSFFEDGHDDSSDEDDLVFQCSQATLAEKANDSDILSHARCTAASVSLEGNYLASSHANGDAFLWDLGRRRIVANFCGGRKKPGLTLRRMGDSVSSSHDSSRQLLYHTRDGIVSIHNLESTNSKTSTSYSCPTCPIVTEFQTESHTFCAASPCAGNPYLVALPSKDESMATVCDIRAPPTGNVFETHGAGEKYDVSGEGRRKHGMLTSLAMSEASFSSLEDTARPVLATGMESGTVFFHDMAMPNRPLKQVSPYTTSCSLELSKNPILTLDLVSSIMSESSASGAVIAVAGMAGDSTDLLELPAADRGTAAVVKTVLPSISTSNSEPVARLRARVATCRVGHDTAGKPGVATCRFRPDGCIFAVGGWDKRLRIFDRHGSAAPLAILKAHSDSVTAVDWSPDAAASGILATGASDGKICLWRCFPAAKT